MLLQVSPPAHTEDASTLALRIETRNPKGQYQPQQHMIRLSPNSSGHYPSAEHAPQGAAATWLSIDPLLLPETTDADK